MARLTQVVIALFLTGNGFANEFSQLSLSLGSEDNVPRGLDSQHERDSKFLQLEYGFGKFFQLGFNDSVMVSGQISASRFNDLSGFDKQGFGFSADYGHKFGFGAYAARIGAVISAAHENYRGDARDNELYTLELNYQKRLSPAWFLYVGIDYQDSETDRLPSDPMVSGFDYDPEFKVPYELFDYESTSIFTELEYAFENGLLLSAGFRRIDGSIVSSTTVPSLYLYKLADGYYTDPAFSSPWFGYLLEADTDEWSAGLSVPVGTDSSIDLGFRWHDIDAVGDRHYENSIVSVTYTHSF